MNSTKARAAHQPAGVTAVQPEHHKLARTIRQTVLISLAVVLTSVVNAANVPPGVTGLWRFQSDTNKLKATLGVDLTTSDTNNSAFFLGPWTVIEPGYSDGGIVQDRRYDYLTVNPSFAANGGGSDVNEYTIAWDVKPDPGWNSLYQTAAGVNDNDGDLWIDATTQAAAKIGVGDVGYSTMTFDATTWHRIVLSVDNGSFFRVYVDGTLFLDGVGQPIDGRFALFTDKFHLFADDNGEDAWLLCGTVATWNRALTTEEVAGMGGWTNGSATPTPLSIGDTMPIVTAVSPANGETNAAPQFTYQATIVDGNIATVAQNSIQVMLDGVPLTPSVTNATGIVTVRFSAGGLLRSGSTHRYTLIFNTIGIVSTITNEVTFTVQNYTSYEWRFTAGDLTTALGDGVMSYADGDTTMGLTTFGTTDGSTVPHIGGVPTKYMHVPAFTSDANGYQLTFNATGPNTGANAYVNRYTILFDILMPNLTATQSPDYIVPFFNTNPFNLTDADFYLRESGQIGIGGGGYSNPGVVTANTWCRVAFVADLAANTLTYYVNGTQVKTRAADGLGGRWAIYSNQDAGPDLLLFNEGDTSGIYTHELYLSSIAFTDRVLNAAEVAALGGPNVNGILVRSFAPRPALNIQTAGGQATVSWPTSYVGFALEQSDNVASPQWKPVAGITNNAVTLSALGSTKFLRLVQ